MKVMSARALARAGVRVRRKKFHLSRAPSWRRNPPRTAMVIKTMFGSGGPCSPAVGSWRSIGKWQEQHTGFFNFLPSPHAHLGHGWRDGPWSAAFMLADAASSFAPQQCFWGKPDVSSPLALNANGRDVSTPTSHSTPVGRDGDL